MKKLTDYLLTEAKEEETLVQAKVPKSLRDAVKEQMKADKTNGVKVTWDTLFVAAFKQYLAERKVLKRVSEK